MTIQGTVRDGTVVLDTKAVIPNGTRVQVIVSDDNGSAPSLLALLEIAGTVNDLPSDMALNHDHYLHGRPKK